MRVLLACLLLVGAACADVPYRDKLLTATDLRAFLPAGWRVIPTLEDFDFRESLGMKQYDYHYKQASVLFLKSAWGVRLDESAAKSEYSKLVAVQALNPLVKVETNLSGQVQVGDESLCVRLKGGANIYVVFSRRQECGLLHSGYPATDVGKGVGEAGQGLAASGEIQVVLSKGGLYCRSLRRGLLTFLESGFRSF